MRLSGPRAAEIALALLAVPPDSQPASRSPQLRSFRHLSGELLLAGAAHAPARLYLMRAPRSYTRQDVAELHLPGSPVIVELALETALAAGARLAEPGEFTRRALENGRISADQAEAVIAVIRARSRSELAAAAAGLAGRGGRQLAAWRARAEDLAARMEAELDYGESAGAFLDDESAARELSGLARELDRIAAREDPTGPAAAGGSEAVRAVLAGPVNAGKSLLFSRLTGREALVSAAPGTTRDVREAPLAAAPRDLAVVDTAGLGAPPGEIELLSRTTAERAWRGADVLVLVADRTDPDGLERLRPAAEVVREAEIPAVLVLNKCDLPAARYAAGAVSDVSLQRSEERHRPPSAADTRDLAPETCSIPVAVLEVSALTGAGCEELAALLTRLVREGQVERSAARSTAALRRQEALARARCSLRSAAEALEDGLGLACAADDLRDAAREVASHFEPGAGRAELDEAVLNRIFARFCVGK